jgi:hypothetical protein
MGEGVASRSAFAPYARTGVPGPELELVEAALESGLAIARTTPIVFREPALPTGFPDIVAVFLSKQELLFSRERLELGSDHLRLLHHIYATRSTTVDALTKALVWGEHAIERLMEALERAELLRLQGRKARCAPLAEIFVARRIVAVEAKIRDWRAAIRQAVANTWFASHSYILIPAERWSPHIDTEAARFGIGVLAHDGRRTLVKLRAADRRIPASYGSWLVNEWTLRHAGRPCD